MNIRRTSMAVALAATLLATAGIAGAAHADPSARLPAGTWADVPDPGSKAKSPPTALDSRPKFTEQQLARMRAQPPKKVVPDPFTTDVVTVTANSVTIYTPAPGSTPEQLAAQLRSQGNKDVRVIRHTSGGDASQLAPNDCAYNNARTATCPVSYWTNNGYEDPIVRFNDHSGAAWPTTDAVYKWNQVPNIDSWYYWNSCPFMAGARCVDVRSRNFGGPPAVRWIGRTTHIYPTTNHSGPYAEQGHLIELNDWFDPAAGGFTRNNVVTHEVGHVLGLGHNVWSGDLMYEFANRREDLGGENPVLLAGLYSVVR